MADDDGGYDLTIWMIKNLWLEGWWWWWWWWFNNLNSNPRLGIEHGWRGEKSDMKHRGVWGIHCTRDGDDDDGWWWWWLFCWWWSMMIVLFMMTMTEDVAGDKKYQVWGFRKFCECFLWHLRSSSPIQGVQCSIVYIYGAHVGGYHWCWMMMMTNWQHRWSFTGLWGNPAASDIRPSLCNYTWLNSLLDYCLALWWWCHWWKSRF